MEYVITIDLKEASNGFVLETYAEKHIPGNYGSEHLIEGGDVFIAQDLQEVKDLIRSNIESYRQAINNHIMEQGKPEKENIGDGNPDKHKSS